MKRSRSRDGGPRAGGCVDVWRARAARERLSSSCAAACVAVGSAGCTLLSEDFSPELLEASPQPAALEMCELACGASSGAGDAGAGDAGIGDAAAGAESSSGGADAAAAPRADGGAVPREPSGSTPFGEGALPAAGVLLSCGTAGAELGAPEQLNIAGVEGELGSPALSGDGLTLFFTAADGAERIYSARRQSRESVVFEGTRVVFEGDDASPSGEATPFVGVDGERLYFSSALPGSGSDKDLFVATFDPVAQSFSAPQPLADLGGPDVDLLPWLTADELTIVFVSSRLGGSGGADLFSAQRARLDASFGAPTPVAALNSAFGEGRAAFTADGATVYFSSDREGQSDLFAATRAANGGGFSAPFAIAGLNSPAFEGDVILSPDGREVLFASERSGDSALFRATRSCR